MWNKERTKIIHEGGEVANLIKIPKGDRTDILDYIASQGFAKPIEFRRPQHEN